MSNTRTILDLPITVSGSIITVSGSFQFANGGNITSGLMTSSLTYYVSVTGSNSNDGLSTSTAFQTLQYAATEICSKQVKYPNIVTLYVMDGTYTGNVVFSGNGFTPIILSGLTTPNNVIINGIVYSNYTTDLHLRNLKLSSLGVQYCGRASVEQNCVFLSPNPAGAAEHMFAIDGGTIRVSNNYSVSGSAAFRHIGVYDGSKFIANEVTASFTGSYNWAYDFIDAAGPSTGRFHQYSSRMAFLGGTHVGVRYRLRNGGCLDTNGGGASYFPGNSAGVSENGGGFYG